MNRREALRAAREARRRAMGGGGEEEDPLLPNDNRNANNDNSTNKAVSSSPEGNIPVSTSPGMTARERRRQLLNAKAAEREEPNAAPAAAVAEEKETTNRPLTAKERLANRRKARRGGRTSAGEGEDGGKAGSATAHEAVEGASPSPMDDGGAAQDEVEKNNMIEDNTVRLAQRIQERREARDKAGERLSQRESMIRQTYARNILDRLSSPDAAQTPQASDEETSFSKDRWIATLIANSKSNFLKIDEQLSEEYKITLQLLHQSVFAHANDFMLLFREVEQASHLVEALKGVVQTTKGMISSVGRFSLQSVSAGIDPAIRGERRDPHTGGPAHPAHIQRPRHTYTSRAGNYQLGFSGSSALYGGGRVGGSGDGMDGVGFGRPTLITRRTYTESFHPPSYRGAGEANNNGMGLHDGERREGERHAHKAELRPVGPLRHPTHSFVSVNSSRVAQHKMEGASVISGSTASAGHLPAAGSINPLQTTSTSSSMKTISGRFASAAANGNNLSRASTRSLNVDSFAQWKHRIGTVDLQTDFSRLSSVRTEGRGTAATGKDKASRRKNAGNISEEASEQQQKYEKQVAQEMRGIHLFTILLREELEQLLAERRYQDGGAVLKDIRKEALHYHCLPLLLQLESTLLQATLGNLYNMPLSPLYLESLHVPMIQLLLGFGRKRSGSVAYLELQSERLERDVRGLQSHLDPKYATKLLMDFLVKSMRDALDRQRTLLWPLVLFQSFQQEQKLLIEKMTRRKSLEKREKRSNGNSSDGSDDDSDADMKPGEAFMKRLRSGKNASSESLAQGGGQMARSLSEAVLNASPKKYPLPFLPLNAAALLWVRQRISLYAAQILNCCILSQNTEADGAVEPTRLRRAINAAVEMLDVLRSTAISHKIFAGCDALALRSLTYSIVTLMREFTDQAARRLRHMVHSTITQCISDTLTMYKEGVPAISLDESSGHTYFYPYNALACDDAARVGNLCGQEVVKRIWHLPPSSAVTLMELILSPASSYLFDLEWSGSYRKFWAMQQAEGADHAFSTQTNPRTSFLASSKSSLLSPECFAFLRYTNCTTPVLCQLFESILSLVAATTGSAQLPKQPIPQYKFHSTAAQREKVSSVAASNLRGVGEDAASGVEKVHFRAQLRCAATILQNALVAEALDTGVQHLLDAHLTRIAEARRRLLQFLSSSSFKSFYARRTARPENINTIDMEATIQTILSTRAKSVSIPPEREDQREGSPVSPQLKRSRTPLEFVTPTKGKNVVSSAGQNSIHPTSVSSQISSTASPSSLRPNEDENFDVEGAEPGSPFGSALKRKSSTFYDDSLHKSNGLKPNPNAEAARYKDPRSAMNRMIGDGTKTIDDYPHRSIQPGSRQKSERGKKNDTSLLKYPLLTNFERSPAWVLDAFLTLTADAISVGIWADYLSQGSGFAILLGDPSFAFRTQYMEKLRRSVPQEVQGWLTCAWVLGRNVQDGTSPNVLVVNEAPQAAGPVEPATADEAREENNQFTFNCLRSAAKAEGSPQGATHLHQLFSHGCLVKEQKLHGLITDILGEGYTTPAGYTLHQYLPMPTNRPHPPQSKLRKNRGKSGNAGDLPTSNNDSFDQLSGTNFRAREGVWVLRPHLSHYPAFPIGSAAFPKEDELFLLHWVTQISLHLITVFQERLLIPARVVNKRYMYESASGSPGSNQHSPSKEAAEGSAVFLSSDGPLSADELLRLAELPIRGGITPQEPEGRLSFLAGGGGGNYITAVAMLQFLILRLLRDGLCRTSTWTAVYGSKKAEDWRGDDRVLRQQVFGFALFMRLWSPLFTGGLRIPLGSDEPAAAAVALNADSFPRLSTEVNSSRGSLQGSFRHDGTERDPSHGPIRRPSEVHTDKKSALEILQWLTCSGAVPLMTPSAVLPSSPASLGNTVLKGTGASPLSSSDYYPSVLFQTVQSFFDVVLQESRAVPALLSSVTPQRVDRAMQTINLKKFMNASLDPEEEDDDEDEEDEEEEQEEEDLEELLASTIRSNARRRRGRPTGKSSNKGANANANLSLDDEPLTLEHIRDMIITYVMPLL